MLKERLLPETFPNLTKLPVNPAKEGSLVSNFGMEPVAAFGAGSCTVALGAEAAFFFVCANAEFARIMTKDNRNKSFFMFSNIEKINF
jgi:hypothetical protein